MLKKFQPQMYIPNYAALNLSLLKQQGIKLLMVDIDNTLVAHHQRHPDTAAIEFLDQIKQAGFEVVLVSNNNAARVQEFVKELAVAAYAQAKKPLKQVYLKVMRDYHLQPTEIAAVGDQLLTDVWGANRVGVFAILTTPLFKQDLIYTKFNRWLENKVFHLLAKKQLLNRQEYYDNL